MCLQLSGSRCLRPSHSAHRVWLMAVEIGRSHHEFALRVQVQYEDALVNHDCDQGRVGGLSCKGKGGTAIDMRAMHRPSISSRRSIPSWTGAIAHLSFYLSSSSRVFHRRRLPRSEGTQVAGHKWAHRRHRAVRTGNTKYRHHVKSFCIERAQARRHITLGPCIPIALRRCGYQWPCKAARTNTANVYSRNKILTSSELGTIRVWVSANISTFGMVRLKVLRCQSDGIFDITSSDSLTWHFYRVRRWDRRRSFRN